MPVMPIVRLHDEGPAVRILQMNLHGLNYNYNGMRITGELDALTQEVVKDFQAENKLVPDGVVGPNTWNVLFEKIRGIQAKLNSINFSTGIPDGIYGPKTASAVTRFQSVNGLTQNGIVDPRTRQQLFNPNPPDDFSKRPTSKSLDALHPYVASLARAFLKECEAEGLDVIILDVFRSWDDQDALYAQGRTQPGNIVTDTMGGDSYHNWGLAFDSAPLVNGAVDWNAADKFDQMGTIGQRVGLEWGGNWTTARVNLIDKPHFQYTFGLSTEQLLDGARPPR